MRSRSCRSEATNGRSPSSRRRRGSRPLRSAVDRGSARSGRASLRTWLYRIATNVCLDALADRKRRFRPIDDGPVGTPEDELIDRPRTHWLEPIADNVAIPADAQPAEQAMLRYGSEMIDQVALHQGWYAEWMPKLKAEFEDFNLELPRHQTVLDDLLHIKVVNGIPQIDKGRQKDL